MVQSYTQAGRQRTLDILWEDLFPQDRLQEAEWALVLIFYLRMGHTCVGAVPVVVSPLGRCRGEVGGEEPGAGRMGLTTRLGMQPHVLRTEQALQILTKTTEL